MLSVQKYDEEILTSIQQLLKKVKVKKFSIKLHGDVTNKTQTDICSKISKNLFELDMAINEVSLFFIVNWLYCIIGHKFNLVNN